MNITKSQIINALILLGVKELLTGVPPYNPCEGSEHNSHHGNYGNFGAVNATLEHSEYNLTQLLNMVEGIKNPTAANYGVTGQQRPINELQAFLHGAGIELHQLDGEARKGELTVVNNMRPCKLHDQFIPGAEVLNFSILRDIGNLPEKELPELATAIKIMVARNAKFFISPLSYTLLNTLALIWAGIPVTVVCTSETSQMVVKELLKTKYW